MTKFLIATLVARVTGVKDLSPADCILGANLLARRDWVVSWHFFELARLCLGRIHLLNRPGQGAAAQRGHGQPA